MLTVLKRIVMWDYARGSWQYDLMVGAIVAFVFLTPRSLFRDQPRIPNASAILALPAENGNKIFWIDSELLSAVPEDQRAAKLNPLLSLRTGKQQVVTRVEPVYDSEKELKGYMAFAKP